MSETIAISSVPTHYAELFRVVAQDEYSRQADLLVDLLDRHLEENDFDDVEAALRARAEAKRREAGELERQVETLQNRVDELRAEADDLREQADEMESGPSYDDRVQDLATQMERPAPSRRPVVHAAETYGRDPKTVADDVRAAQAGDAR